jgi:hypothetical protein
MVDRETANCRATSLGRTNFSSNISLFPHDLFALLLIQNAFQNPDPDLKNPYLGSAEAKEQYCH